MFRRLKKELLQPLRDIRDTLHIEEIHFYLTHHRNNLNPARVEMKNLFRFMPDDVDSIRIDDQIFLRSGKEGKLNPTQFTLEDVNSRFQYLNRMRRHLGTWNPIK